MEMAELMAICDQERRSLALQTLALLLALAQHTTKATLAGQPITNQQPIPTPCHILHGFSWYIPGASSNA